MTRRAGRRKPLKYLKKLDRAESRAETAEVNVNEEDLDMEGASGLQAEEREQELDPIQLQKGRREGLEYMPKTLQMFELGSLQEAMSRGGNAPTTTKWVGRAKKGL